MNIQMFQADEVVSRRGRGGKKGSAKYADYAQAVKPHLEWLEEQINESSDNMIRVKLEEFSKACGKVMKKIVNGEVVGTQGLDPTSLTWAYRYVLFHFGYVFTMGNVDDGQPVMIIRRRQDGDVLPASLAKYDRAKSGNEVDTDNADSVESDSGTF